MSDHKTDPQAGYRAEALPVIVVGAGPVGLLCALELARRDVPVLVIESEAALVRMPRPVGS